MANLTLAIDDDLLRAARIKAVQQGTSVNDICRDAITRFAAPAVDHDDFITQLRALAARNRVKLRAGAAVEPLPSRSDMMDEAMVERMTTLSAALARK
jgi:plasmid stability protein